jgi:hypothetical protein
MEAFYPELIVRDTLRQSLQSVCPIPAGQFLHVKPERMVFRNTSGINVTAQVFIPAGYSLVVCFHAESVQFPLTYRFERNGTLVGRTIFRFFRQ